MFISIDPHPHEKYVEPVNIELLPFKRELLETYLGWRNEPASLRHNPLAPMSREEIGVALTREGTDLSDLKSHTTYRWVIYVTDVPGLTHQTPVPVGTFSMRNVNLSMFTADIGYMVGSEFQGRGIATASVKHFADRIFKETELRKLIATVHDENLPSLRVLDKVGFQREGFLREHFLIQGKPAHQIIFGLLRKDWSR